MNTTKLNAKEYIVIRTKDPRTTREKKKRLQRLRRSKRVATTKIKEENSSDEVEEESNNETEEDVIRTLNLITPSQQRTTEIFYSHRYTTVMYHTITQYSVQVGLMKFGNESEKEVGQELS